MRVSGQVRLLGCGGLRVCGAWGGTRGQGGTQVDVSASVLSNQ